MGFKGYWFNMDGADTRTCKYPHCYVGIPIDRNPTWGFYNKVSDDEHDVTWADYGGRVLQHTGLSFNSLGTNYVIEDTWHMLTGTEAADQVNLYDANLKELRRPKYTISIFYKLILPSTISSNNDPDLRLWKADPVNNTDYAYTTLDKLRLEIGGVPCFNYNSYEKGLWIGRNPLGSLALPSDVFLGYDSKIPVGTELAGLTGTSYGWATDSGTTSNNIHLFQDADIGANATDTKFLATGQQGVSGANVLRQSMLTGVSYSGGSVSYEINTSAAFMGVPFTGKDNYKFLLPRLFEGFILINPCGARYRRFNTTQGIYEYIDPPLVGALYMCLGVKPIS